MLFSDYASVNTERVSMIMLLAKVWKSNEWATDKTEQTLVVFFASDCGHCEELLKTLQAQYKTLQDKHIRIVALAADTDEALFNKAKAAFPWQDTYCDLKGMSGVNFKAFAVPGTPTMVLVNKQGIITLRTSHLEEVLNMGVGLSKTNSLITN